MSKLVQLKDGTGNVYPTTFKSIITAIMSGDLTLTNTTATKINLPTNYASVGNKLSIDNNGILIGTGVTKIKLSVQMRNTVSATAGYRHLTIYKNGEVMAQTTEYRGDSIQQYLSFCLSSKLISVSAGDHIYLWVIGTNGDVINSSNAYTFLTAEVVE